jgi:indolepyruvate ferredoxin oxidoreductase alpha subunit
MSRSRLLLSGNQAVARGAAENGVNVATSYPGTPCTEILETLSTHKFVRAMWSTNEKVAYEVALGRVCGRPLAGGDEARRLNVAADPLFSSVYTGINAGMVIVVGDDPSASSSQNEQDSRHYARAAKLPHARAFRQPGSQGLVGEAFEMSERFDTPVLLRMTTRLCHSKTVVQLERCPTTAPATGFVRDFEKFVLSATTGLLRHAVIEHRLIAWPNTPSNLRSTGLKCVILNWGSSLLV